MEERGYDRMCITNDALVLLLQANGFVCRCTGGQWFETDCHVWNGTKVLPDGTIIRSYGTRLVIEGSEDDRALLYEERRQLEQWERQHRAAR